MIAHAFSSGALFLAFGMLYQRCHTREINGFGGIAKAMPIFTAMFVAFCMSNIGLPGTAGFVGEFMVILASIKASPVIGVLTASTVVLSASYTLWMVKRVFYGPCNQTMETLSDISITERSSLTLLLLALLCLGIYPKPLMQVMHHSLDHLRVVALQSKINPS